MCRIERHVRGRKRITLRNAYIKFLSEQDSILGCEKLAAHSPVSRLTNGIFCIPWGSLSLLDAIEISYSFASEADLLHAHPVWNFAAPRAG